VEPVRSVMSAMSLFYIIFIRLHTIHTFQSDNFSSERSYEKSNQKNPPRSRAHCCWTKQ